MTHVKTLETERIAAFFRGIEDRDVDLAVKYLHPEKYRQHNPFSAVGVEGLKDWIGRLPPARSALTTVRAFQDSAYVFTQTRGDVPDPSVFFDVFRIEDGLIVEHWVFQGSSQNLPKYPTLRAGA